LEAVNFAAEYKERVFSAFLAEYQAGRTPNPDVLCNAEIKFKAFLDHALALGAGCIATGHYACVREVQGGGIAGRYELLKAADRGKDQSYFLHRLSQTQLASAVFPLAQLQKTEVRRIAKEAGLPVHAKRDSTGICFIGERPFREFLNRYLPHEPGAIRTPEGRVIGEHVGLAFYTIGQRKGIGIGGVKDSGAQGEAWYVAGKDMQKNELVVVHGHDHALLQSASLRAADLSWVGGSAPDAAAAYAAKTRYRQADAPCRICLPGSEICEFRFDRPQWAVTPGQSAVLYQGEVCLGGGVIQ
jgi:tRNA-specific 2-thiouridylase